MKSVLTGKVGAEALLRGSQPGHKHVAARLCCDYHADAGPPACCRSSAAQRPWAQTRASSATWTPPTWARALVSTTAQWWCSPVATKSPSPQTAPTARCTSEATARRASPSHVSSKACDDAFDMHACQTIAAELVLYELLTPHGTPSACSKHPGFASSASCGHHRKPGYRWAFVLRLWLCFARAPDCQHSSTQFVNHLSLTLPSPVLCAPTGGNKCRIDLTTGFMVCDGAGLLRRLACSASGHAPALAGQQA